MNLLFEDMIRVETDNYICRIWRGSGGSLTMSSDALKQITRDYLLCLEDGVIIPSVAIRNIAEVDQVNSVEIVDRATGCGVCVHKDWP